MNDPDAPDEGTNLQASTEDIPLTFPGTGSNDVSEVSTSEVAPAPPPKPKKPAWKPPKLRLNLKRPSLSPNLTLGWQTRFKVAVVLSFVALVSVLVVNRLHREETGKKPTELAINSHPRAKEPEEPGTPGTDQTEETPRASKPSAPKPEVATSRPNPASTPPRPLDPSALEAPTPEPPAIEPIRQTAALSEPPAPLSNASPASGEPRTLITPSAVPPLPSEASSTEDLLTSGAEYSVPPVPPRSGGPAETLALSQPPAPASEPSEPTESPVDVMTPSPSTTIADVAEPSSTPADDPAPPVETASVDDPPSPEPESPSPAAPMPAYPALTGMENPAPVQEASPGAGAPDLSLDMGTAPTAQNLPIPPDSLAGPAPSTPPDLSLDMGPSEPTTPETPVAPLTTDPTAVAQDSTPTEEPSPEVAMPAPAKPVPAMPAGPVSAPADPEPAPVLTEATPAPRDNSNASMAITPGSLQLQQPPPSTGSVDDSRPPEPRSPRPKPGASAELASSAPAQSPEPDEAPVGGRIDPITHVVRRGETFYSISRYYYGSGRFYRALWMANREHVPDLSHPLWVGTAILVPAPEDLDRSLIDPPRPLTGALPPSSKNTKPATGSPVDNRTERTGRFMPAPSDESFLSLPRSSSDPAPASEPSPVEPVLPRSTPRVHVVSGPYETLRSIARQELGDPEREKELLDLNADQVDNPNQLTVGDRIRLPEPR